MFKKLNYTEKAAIVQLIQTIILCFFIFQMFTPTSELSKLPDLLEYILLFSNFAVMAGIVTGVLSFVLLKESKQAGEKSYMKIPIVLLSIVNMIAAVLYLVMWIFVIVGALQG